MAAVCVMQPIPHSCALVCRPSQPPVVGKFEAVEGGKEAKVKAPKKVWCEGGGRGSSFGKREGAYITVGLEPRSQKLCPRASAAK